MCPVYPEPAEGPPGTCRPTASHPAPLLRSSSYGRARPPRRPHHAAAHTPRAFLLRPAGYGGTSPGIFGGRAATTPAAPATLQRSPRSAVDCASLALRALLRSVCLRFAPARVGWFRDRSRRLARAVGRASRQEVCIGFALQNPDEIRLVQPLSGSFRLIWRGLRGWGGRSRPGQARRECHRLPQRGRVVRALTGVPVPWPPRPGGG